MAVHWRECQPEFWIPREMDCSRFSAYDQWDPETPDFVDIVNLAGLGRIPKWAWAAWFKAHANDAPLNMDPGLQLELARRVYDSKRFVHVVPQWRRYLIDTLTEIDDIEDQVSTIAWLAEVVLAKVLPIPRSALNFANGLSRKLDDAQAILSLGFTSRSSKASWAGHQREIREAKRGARAKHAQLITWFKENWGNLLEAAQATNTWFDVGIVLGPIVGYVEDGLWTASKKTLDNYLIAAEAFMPGIRDAYWEQLELLGQAVDDRVDEIIEDVTTWDNSELQWYGETFNELNPDQLWSA